MTAKEGHLKLRFDVPDKQGDKIRLDELATFGLHLDIVKQRVIDLMSKAATKTDGYDLVIDD
jgi:hypothetical protein